MEKGRSGSDAEEKAKEGEKRLSHKEAIEKISKLIGTPAPIQEADSLRKQLATVGDENSEIPPEMQAAVEDLEKRTKESKESKST
jgi:hypothetical protein